MVAILATAVLAITGCAKSETAEPSATGGGSTPATSTPAGDPTSATPSPPGDTGGDAAAWCDLVIRVNTKWGLMVNKHYLPPGEVAMEQLVGLVDEALAGANQYVAASPPAIRRAVEIQLQYFQALKDHNFDVTSVLLPDAEFAQATEDLNAFQEDKCGVTFDT
ncbi:MAG: hypothetical protein L0Y54_06200 [Sporichthyaceae bacterium]|nr:hypothetical protein [Sporichthyaceae bacterium]